MCQLLFPFYIPEAFDRAAEILASGVVLLSSGVGGASEIFEPSLTGYSFQPGSTPSLSSTIKSCLSNPDKLLSVSTKGKHHVVENFDVSVSAAKLETLFQQSLIN